MDFDTLLSYQGVRKIDVILDGEGIGGINPECLLALLEHEGLRNADVTPRRPLFDHTDTSDRFRIWTGAPIENRNFKIVELDKSIVDSHTIEGRKEMLDGRNRHAIFF